MMKKKVLLGLMFILMVTLLAYFASSLMFFPNFNSAQTGNINQNITITSGDNGTTRLTFVNGTNLSGTVKINFSFNANGTHNQHIVNITTFWNGSTDFTSSLFNTSANQYGNGTGGFWENNSFDTTLLTDGVYNISVFALNSTHTAAALGRNDTGRNRFVIGNVTVDNTPPSVGNLSIDRNTFNDATYLNNFTHNSGNRTINASASDTLTNISRVYFEFNNATSSSSGSAFNITAIANGSGFNYTSRWSQNFSALRGGYHTLKVIAIDFAGSVNQTTTLNFNVNTPPNVTVINYSAGYNISHSNKNQTFNISVTNSTHGSGASNVTGLVFMFDNASGNDFNRTISFNSLTRTNHGHHWVYSYNLSTLEEGYNTILVFANDTEGNVNKSINLSFRVDKTAPSVTVSCSPSSVEQSAAAPTCTCSTSDTGSGVKTTSFNPSPSTATVGTITTKTCSGTDFAGNAGTATTTFTVTEVSSSGSGTGGSGGGSSSSSKGQFAKTTWASIFSGETAVVNVNNGEVGITEVSFDASKDVYGAWVSVNKKENFPSSVSSFAGKEYKKVEISTGPALKEGTFEKAAVKFKVLKTWLAENELEKGGVAMFRYADDKWNELSTSIGEDDGTYVHYTSETPGFSYFVIGEREEGSAPLPEVAPSGDEAPTGAAPSEGSPSGDGSTGGPSDGAPTWPWALAALVVIIAAVAFYLAKKK